MSEYHDRAGAALVIRYDPKHNLTYGYYCCPECDSRMYGGGPFLHREPCGKTQGLEFWVGPPAITKILESDHHLNPVNAEQVRAALPEEARRFNPGPAFAFSGGGSGLDAAFQELAGEMVAEQMLPSGSVDDEVDALLAAEAKEAGRG